MNKVQTKKCISLLFLILAAAPTHAQELWPMLAFLFVTGFIALKRYRQTLD